MRRSGREQEGRLHKNETIEMVAERKKQQGIEEKRMI